MQGNVVNAAKWIAGSIMLGSLILVVGVNWTVCAHLSRLESTASQANASWQPPLREPAEPEAVARVGSDARTEQLRCQLDDLRQTDAGWKQYWFNDQPSHLTADGIIGAIGP